jgi:hypothetical protein
VTLGIAGLPSFDFDLYREDAGTADNVEYTIAFLTRFRDEVRADGRRLIVVLIPTKEQIEDDYWQTFSRHLGLDPTLDRFVVNRRIQSALHAKGVTTVDMTAVFEGLESRRSGPFYYRGDGHWNSYGHEAAAGALVDLFSTHGDGG